MFGEPNNFVGHRWSRNLKLAQFTIHLYVLLPRFFFRRSAKRKKINKRRERKKGVDFANILLAAFAPVDLS
jgi:hypothetical protein